MESGNLPINKDLSPIEADQDPYSGPLLLGNVSGDGHLMALPDDGDPLPPPFHQSVILLSEERRYAMHMREPFLPLLWGVRKGKALTVRYGSPTFPTQVIGTVESIAKNPAKAYPVSSRNPCVVELISPFGESLPADTEKDRALHDRIDEEVQRTLKGSYTRREVNALEAHLRTVFAHDLFGLRLSADWAEDSSQELTFHIMATPPLVLSHFAITPGQDGSTAWLNDMLQKGEWGKFDTLIAENSLMTMARVEEIHTFFKNRAAENSDWDIEGPDWESDPNDPTRVVGRYYLIPTSIDRLTITVDFQTETVPFPSDSSHPLRKATIEKALAQISGHYAAQGKILVTSEDKQVFFPYLPLGIRRGSTLFFNSSHPLYSIPTPHSLAFHSHSNGKNISPFDRRITRWFREGGPHGPITTLSLIHGLDSLKTWYERRGYLAVITPTVREGIVDIDVQLLSLKKITFLPPPDSEKHLRTLERYFVTLTPGEPLNIQDLKEKMRIAQADLPYAMHYDLKLEESGAVSVEISLQDTPKTLSASLGRGIDTLLNASATYPFPEGQHIGGEVRILSGGALGGSLFANSARSTAGGYATTEVNGLHSTSQNDVNAEIGYTQPLPDSPVNVSAGLIVGEHLDDTGNSPYAGPRLGIGYARGNFSAQISAGPMWSTEGHLFGLGTGRFSYHYPLNDAGDLYLQVYSGSSVMVGEGPLPFLQPAPLSVFAGVAIMKRLDPLPLAVGVGVRAGSPGTTSVLAAGIAVDLTFLRLLLGPAVKRGRPRLFAVTPF